MNDWQWKAIEWIDEWMSEGRNEWMTKNEMNEGRKEFVFQSFLDQPIIVHSCLPSFSDSFVHPLPSLVFFILHHFIHHFIQATKLLFIHFFFPSFVCFMYLLIHSVNYYGLSFSDLMHASIMYLFKLHLISFRVVSCIKSGLLHQVRQHEIHKTTRNKTYVSSCWLLKRKAGRPAIEAKQVDNDIACLPIACIEQCTRHLFHQAWPTKVLRGKIELEHLKLKNRKTFTFNEPLKNSL